MFLSMNWIGDFVDFSGLDKKSLIKNFTLSTAEVEDIIVKGEDTYGVIVARIESIENHPNSKKLHLLKVNTGSAVIDVVCGAPNVREGMKVALATVGGSVCGHAIGEAVVAGFPSFGMCCSEAELGISDDNSGIWDITDDIALGTDIKSVYPIDDIIFEVDNKSLTNRPDLWSHYGMAREFATLTGRELKKPAMQCVKEYESLPPVDVQVKDGDLCLRYTAIKVENVQRKVSPVDMRIRLFYCGSRAINFLADLTNYVMLELGQPMHAFDCAKVNKIEVQTFKDPFVFRTLDGTDRNMDDKMLMITSGDEPVAVAGIMGGDASKIEDDTSSLLLESATFDGVSIRKTSTRLGLRTDASMRYEKMLDPELCPMATKRLLALLLSLDEGAKVISSFTDCYMKHYPEITLTFDKKYVDRYTGIDISIAEIKKTLTALGFALTEKDGDFTVTVPSWRATKDVTLKADIIEEITRIYGYDNFEVKPSVSPLAPKLPEKAKAEENRIKDLLVKSYRMHEVHSYIWSDLAKNKALGIETPENVRVINAQTPDHQFLRVSMIPTLLSFTKENRGYGEEFSIFEIGHTVEGLCADGKCNEQKKLGAILFSRKESEEATFLRARDAIVELCEDILHKSPVFKPAEPAFGFEHPQNCYTVTVADTVIGYLSVPYPTVKEAIDKKASIAFFEINTDTFSKVSAGIVKYAEPSRFPAIEMDMTFACEIGSANFELLKDAAKAATDAPLSSVSVQDIYEGDGEKSATLTLRFAFSASDRTLTKQELLPAMDAIAKAYATFGLIAQV